MDIVTEKLLYQESKQKKSIKDPEEALPTHHRYSQRKHGMLDMALTNEVQLPSYLCIYGGDY